MAKGCCKLPYRFLVALSQKMKELGVAIVVDEVMTAFRCGQYSAW
jgi:glutamate-1-semialdehyde aminotransferase